MRSREGSQSHEPLIRPSSAKNIRYTVARRCGRQLFCLMVLSVRAAEPPRELRPARLRLLYSDSLFLNVKRNDALAAIKTWVETLGRRRGYNLAVEIGFYDRVEEATTRIREKTVDMITCTSLEYLQLTPTEQIEPVFSPGWHQVADEYVMLTRRDRHLTTLADLRGKSAVFYRTGAGLGRLWVDVSLGEQGLGSVNDFFGSNSEALKVSSVILPVFFGKTDAAVVKRLWLGNHEGNEPATGGPASDSHQLSQAARCRDLPQQRMSSISKFRTTWYKVWRRCMPIRKDSRFCCCSEPKNCCRSSPSTWTECGISSPNQVDRCRHRNVKPP